MRLVAPALELAPAMAAFRSRLPVMAMAPRARVPPTAPSRVAVPLVMARFRLWFWPVSLLMVLVVPLKVMPLVVPLVVLSEAVLVVVRVRGPPLKVTAPV